MDSDGGGEGGGVEVGHVYEKYQNTVIGCFLLFLLFPVNILCFSCGESGFDVWH